MNGWELVGLCLLSALLPTVAVMSLYRQRCIDLMTERDEAVAELRIRLTDDLGAFDLIHASPPCQAYAGLASKDGRHSDLIPETRLLLAGQPHVIENIEGAPLLDAVRLCGSSFGLGVRRHRRCEASFSLLVPPCNHHGQAIRGYYGRNYGPALTSAGAIQRGRKPLYRGTVAEGAADMGIDWMEWDELREAIPPAYTEHIGRQFLDQLARR